jgi:hypothetical protein
MIKQILSFLASMDAQGVDAIEMARDPDGLVAFQIEQVQKQTERFMAKGGRE